MPSLSKSTKPVWPKRFVERRAHRHPTGRREDGATLIVVAVSLLLLVGMAAVAVDLGAGWEKKRELVIDTDAAALAGARGLAYPAAGSTVPARDCNVAKQEAESYLSTNYGVNISLTEGDDFFCDGTAGTVRVDFTDKSPEFFGGVLTEEQISVFSSSTAKMVGEVDYGRTRPLAVCHNHPLVNAFLAADQAPLRATVAIDKQWKGDGTDCSGAGNFGYVCFEGKCGNGKNEGDVPQLILDGYGGSVVLGNPSDPHDNGCPDNTEGENPEDEDGTPWCSSGPGEKGASNAAKWTSISCEYPEDLDCLTFPILVIDEVSKSGRLDMRPVAALYVTYFGWCDGTKAGGWQPLLNDISLHRQLQLCGETGSDTSLKLHVELRKYQVSGSPADTEVGGARRVSIVSHDGS